MTFLHLHDKIMMLVANGVQLQSYLSNACGRNFCQRPCGVTRCDVCIGFPKGVIFGGMGEFICLFVCVNIFVNVHAD